MVYYIHALYVIIYVCVWCGIITHLYTYIYVGLSALLVSTYRAMREPRYVERAEDWLHVFLYISLLI